MKRRVCRSDSVGHLDPGERPSVERHALPVARRNHRVPEPTMASRWVAVGVRDEPTQRRPDHGDAEPGQELVQLTGEPVRPQRDRFDSHRSVERWRHAAAAVRNGGNDTNRRTGGNDQFRPASGHQFVTRGWRDTSSIPGTVRHTSSTSRSDTSHPHPSARRRLGRNRRCYRRSRRVRRRWCDISDRRPRTIRSINETAVRHGRRHHRA